MLIRVLVTILVIVVAGCSGDRSQNSGSHNNNGTTQNGSTTNGATNNVGMNTGQNSSNGGNTNQSTNGQNTNNQFTNNQNTNNQTNGPDCDEGCGINEICDADEAEAICVCASGFSDSGSGCEPSPLTCVTDLNCGARATCVAGVCECSGGTVGDGFHCSLLSDCASDTEVCSPDAGCVNTSAGTACICKPGYRGNGELCQTQGFSELRAGVHRTCGIRLDGIMSCWGRDVFGTTLTAQWAGYPNDEPNGALWAHLGDPEDSGCSIKTDGSMWCGEDRTDQVGAGRTWSLVESSVGSHCAIDSTGSLWCWGQNDFGQLGLGTDIRRADEPTQVGSEMWADVTIEPRHACGIQTNGTLWCWGDDQWGQVGPTASDTPIQVGLEEDWESVAVVRNTTCGLRGGGEWWCWGFPDATDGTPFRVGNETWTDIDIARHWCGVRSDGSLWCRGDHQRGAHGSDELELQNLTRVGSDTDWTSVTTGQEQTCALRIGGSAWCFGGNLDAQLGIGTFQFQRYPLRVAQKWTDVTSGQGFTCAIRDDGRLACTGALAVFTPDARPRPEFELVGTDTWLDIDAGWSHLCGVRSDQTLWCGGVSNWGQTGSVGAPRELHQVDSATDWEAVFARERTSCALRSGGELYCWGDNDRTNFDPDSGAMIDGPTRIGTDTWAMVEFDRFQAFGIRSDGTLWDFRSEAAAGTDTWKEISVGYDGQCGIKSDDTLWCWGSNPPGIDTGDPVDEPTQVGSTTWRTVELYIRVACGVQTDGTLWCWGTDTGAGETGTNVYGGTWPVPELVSNISGWVDLERGVQTSFGIRDDGTLWAWGLNDLGQLGTGTGWSSAPLQVRE